MTGVRIGGVRVSVASRWVGRGYLAGQLPADASPGSPDGRFRILNKPSIGRIVVFDRETLEPVAATISRSDGTWEIQHLEAKRRYLVVGFDDRGEVNAAVQDWVVPAVDA